jgi:hypothetical protein
MAMLTPSISPRAGLALPRHGFVNFRQLSDAKNLWTKQAGGPLYGPSGVGLFNQAGIGQGAADQPLDEPGDRLPAHCGARSRADLATPTCLLTALAAMKTPPALEDWAAPSNELMRLTALAGRKVTARL